jgi:hypothetical protein
LFLKALFSNFVSFREKKINCHCFHRLLFLRKELPT